MVDTEKYEHIPKEIRDQIVDFKKTKIPKCCTCKKPWIKVKSESGPSWSVWKPGCKCIKKDIRMSVG